MAISFYSEELSFTLPQKRNRAKWLLSVARSEGKKAGDIQYVFVSDQKILEINKEYLKHDYFTDIITFPYEEGDILSGDIFISVDTVRSNAVEYSQTFEDELDRVISHGLLHLLGFDDRTEIQQKQMRLKEEECLASRSLYLHP